MDRPSSRLVYLLDKFMDSNIIEAFNYIDDKPIEPLTGKVAGLDQLNSVKTLQIGTGAQAWHADQQGQWMGAEEFADAPFSVDMDGNLIASSATIGGGSQNFVSTLAWTATDADTATWGAGTIKVSGGTSYTISGGNTGNIAAKTYIYLDPDTSITVLQTTTTATSAIGGDKILIAIVEIGAVGSECIITVVSSNGTTIDGDGIVTDAITASKIVAGAITTDKLAANAVTAAKITAGTITATEIAANTITAAEIATNAITADEIAAGAVTASKISVSTLSAITANIGAITAGTIDGVVITASQFRTSSSGSRVVIDDDLVGTIDAISLIGSDSSTLYIYNDNSGHFDFDGGDAYFEGSIRINNGITAEAGNITLNSHVDIASGKNLVFLGTQGSINCGNIDSNSIEMNNQALTNVASMSLQARTNPTNGDRELINEDEGGGDQRLRFKFANNGTQWSVDLTAICTPVKKSDFDPIYFEKYELMEELNNSRFKKRYANKDDVQKEYRGQPRSHFPSMGGKGDELFKHNEAMWKRPWLPMKRIPDRMETMSQYPYPPVHSALIGEGESKANLYQLIAHAYNQLQERCDKLELEVRRLGGNV